jgi:hypothetical protein
LENNTDFFVREVRVTDERLADIVERPGARHFNRELLDERFLTHGATPGASSICLVTR